MDFINKLLDENYDWGDERIDEDVNAGFKLEF